MNKFMNAIDTVTKWILGDRRDSIIRRVKTSKQKKTRRTTKKRRT